MAKIFPDVEEDFHNSFGEYKIFNALKKLPDEWNIYHSINWQQRDKHGIIRWGEADFLIFNRNYGILVVEVKSGGINFENGQWKQRRLDTLEEFNMKNPFIQANRSKFKIIEELDNNLPIGEKSLVDKIVWFPSILRDDVDKIQLPLEYNKRLILTEESMGNPLDALVNAYNFYNAKQYTHLTEIGEKKVKEIIMPNFNLVPSASNVKNEVNYIFYQLTNEQQKVLDFISDQNTVAIQGSAGTGKTFIAVEQAKRFSNCGKVLFMCFNKYLNIHLKSKCMFRNVDYYTLHSFVSQYSNEDVYNIQKCIEEFNKIDFSSLEYKYIIVDEAQDFNKEILKELYDNCIKNKIKLLIFYDKNQLVFQNELPEIIKYFDSKLTLLKNCRNTVKITSSVNSIFNIPIEVNELSAIGVMPTLNYVDSEKKIIDAISKSIDKYLKNGFESEDIVILTLTTEKKSVLYNIKEIDNQKVILERNNKEIFFTTAKKFKGLESNIVIVVDFNPVLYEDYDYKKNLYVALSRARQRLELYTVATEEEMNKIANTIKGDINTLAKIGRKFKMIINKIEED